MFVRSLVLVCWMLVVPFRTLAEPLKVQPVELALRVGDQRSLPSEGVRSYSEGTPGVVDIRLTRDASQFILVAQQPGDTTLLLLMLDNSERHYRIKVNAREPQTDPNSQLLPVRASNNIRLDFYFVQLDKSYNHRIGIGWPSALGPATLGAEFDLRQGTLDSASAVITDQALPRLDMAQANGWAKVMRQAAVITENGLPATFSGGGEVNIPIQGSLATGIHQIAFGSTIEVLPRYDSKSGRLQLKIHANVSDLTDDRGTGTPGRTLATLDTTVNIELGQSLMLAGLTASSETHVQTGLPLLSQLPVLGVLFGSNADTRQQTRNVVFIVPSVIDAVAADSRARIREALDIYQKYAGDIDSIQLGPKAEAR